jgi:hypothetical protein
MDNEKIHRRLKSIMASKGISQVDVARKLSEKLKRPVSRQMVNHVFKGRVKNQTVRETICEILEIDLNDVWM